MRSGGRQSATRRAFMTIGHYTVRPRQRQEPSHGTLSSDDLKYCVFNNQSLITMTYLSAGEQHSLIPSCGHRVVFPRCVFSHASSCSHRKRELLEVRAHTCT